MALRTAFVYDRISQLHQPHDYITRIAHPILRPSSHAFRARERIVPRYNSNANVHADLLVCSRISPSMMKEHHVNSRFDRRSQESG